MYACNDGKSQNTESQNKYGIPKSAQVTRVADAVLDFGSLFFAFLPKVGAASTVLYFYFPTTPDSTTCGSPEPSSMHNICHISHE
jgi:hypothetical protein